MKTQLILTTIILLTSTSTSFALSLEEGKKQGVVGETVNGYLEARSTSPEAKQLVQDINQKRSEAYKAIAEKHGADTDVVAQLAAKEAVQKAPAGTYVKTESGEWKRK